MGPVDVRVRYDVFARPHYAYGVYSAAMLAKQLGLKGISVFELGVAGGRGLISLQDVSEEIAEFADIRIDVFGLDGGTGMPRALDFRDLPHVWGQGDYAMDETLLRSKLGKAKLMVGDVAQTAKDWLAQSDNLPIGFISFDLDYYSSTVKAFSLFDAVESTRLPRVYCYFDDIIYPERGCHNEYTGELCAIKEFNEQHDTRKICPVHLLRHTRLRPAPWNEQTYVMHDFQHPLYSTNTTPQTAHYTQRPL